MLLTRRHALGAAGALAGAAAGCRPARSGSGAASGLRPERVRYGDDAAQYAELYLPTARRPRAVAIVIHGGFWRPAYDASLGRPLAADLAARGYAAWNLEYRRVGAGGGWPGTLADVAAGIDRLADHDVGLDRVVAIGHSAGGQLAAWAASRPGLPAGAPGAAPRVRLTAVVSQAGVLDLAAAADTGVGAGAVTDLMGGTPAEEPARYRLADPLARLPLGVPLLAVHSRADTVVPFAQSAHFVTAAVAAGDDAALLEVHGDHMSLIDPGSKAWSVVLDALPKLLA